MRLRSEGGGTRRALRMGGVRGQAGGRTGGDREGGGHLEAAHFVLVGGAVPAGVHVVHHRQIGRLLVLADVQDRLLPPTIVGPPASVFLRLLFSQPESQPPDSPDE